MVVKLTAGEKERYTISAGPRAPELKRKYQERWLSLLDPPKVEFRVRRVVDGRLVGSYFDAVITELENVGYAEYLLTIEVEGFGTFRGIYNTRQGEGFLEKQ